MPMSNREWKAMLTRNGVAKPKAPRTKRAANERDPNHWWWSPENLGARMRDEMNADISREMGGYNEDL